MSMRLFAAFLLMSLAAVSSAVGCGGDSKGGCNPAECAPVKCPEGERRACIDDECVSDTKLVCAGQT